MKMPDRLLIWSFAVAAVAGTSRWTVLPLTPTTFDFVYFSAALVIPWLLLFIVSVQRLGRRGLWGLVGAPLLLCWPVAFVLLWWSCRHGYECL
jgi:hypothetical protein